MTQEREINPELIKVLLCITNYRAVKYVLLFHNRIDRSFPFRNYCLMLHEKKSCTRWETGFHTTIRHKNHECEVTIPTTPLPAALRQWILERDIKYLLYIIDITIAVHRVLDWQQIQTPAMMSVFYHQRCIIHFTSPPAGIYNTQSFMTLH